MSLFSLEDTNAYKLFAIVIKLRRDFKADLIFSAAQFNRLYLKSYVFSVD